MNTPETVSLEINWRVLLRAQSRRLPVAAPSHGQGVVTSSSLPRMDCRGGEESEGE